MAVHAELRFHLREYRRPLRELRAPIRDALVVDQDGQVIPDRSLELGLVVHRLDHGRVGLDARQRGIERLRRHAFRRCLALELAHARAKVGGAGLGGSRCQQERQ